MSSRLWTKILLRNNVAGVKIFCMRNVATETMEPLVLSRRENSVQVISLNNPKKRNALSLDLLGQLEAAFHGTLQIPNIRAILLRATGNVFSAGHDLTELRSSSGSDYHEKVFGLCTKVMTLIQDLPIPVVAEVRGLATAAGCQLVASCDVAIASESTRFATPGIKVGLFCSTPGVALARSIPRKAAMLMLLTGEPISAQDALRHGLVSEVVPDGQLEDKAMSVARKISEASGPVLALGKAAFYRQIAMNRDSAYKYAEETMMNNLKLADSQEGIDAFLQKRSPVWTHDDK